MLNRFKERAQEIKKARMEAEFLAYNELSENFLNFNIEKELKENYPKVAQELKSSRIWNGLGTAAFIGVIGAAGVVAGPAGILGTALVGSMLGAIVPVVATICDFTTTAEKENKRQVMHELQSLKEQVDGAAVKEKTTIKDLFKAAKETIKDIYIENKNKSEVKEFFVKSKEDILAKRKEMHDKMMSKGISTSPKPT